MKLTKRTLAAIKREIKKEFEVTEYLELVNLESPDPITIWVVAIAHSTSRIYNIKINTAFDEVTFGINYMTDYTDRCLHGDNVYVHAVLRAIMTATGWRSKHIDDYSFGKQDGQEDEGHESEIRDEDGTIDLTPVELCDIDLSITGVEGCFEQEQEQKQYLVLYLDYACWRPAITFDPSLWSRSSAYIYEIDSEMREVLGHNMERISDVTYGWTIVARGVKGEPVVWETMIKGDGCLHLDTPGWLLVEKSF